MIGLDRIEDLIAMIALYRPGPMEHIPTFIKSKHGLEARGSDAPASAVSASEAN